jgi:DNA-binding MarR family transcriptional regulator
MPQAQPDAERRWAKLEKRRGRNLRQLLLRASRAVNREVVAGLQARGYTTLRATHTTLLSNIDLAGSTITEAADRAGITKQAMGRLAMELQATGYIVVAGDPGDARAKRLRLTPEGERLMLDSLEVMAELEDRYARQIGGAGVADLRQALEAFVGACD